MDTRVDAFKRKIDGLTPFPTTWAAFEKLLKEEFDEPAKEENAYTKLCSLRPASGELMSDYVSRFVALAKRSKINDLEAVQIFAKSIPVRISNAIALDVDMKKTLENWMKKAIALAQNTWWVEQARNV